ncbi:hypothetical protein SNL152K_5115 [Streptomyces sp. NL15-2K]|nr:hypothetical protein SNL152K_5115 [Streptomyces sp. NL15-2K]
MRVDDLDTSLYLTDSQKSSWEHWEPGRRLRCTRSVKTMRHGMTREDTG